MSELLREAVKGAPSLRAIETATGVNRLTIQRFRDRRQSLRLDKADDLAAYFGIESKQARRRR